MIFESPICLDCEYYDQLEIRLNTCKAFSQGIPEAIITGEHDHRKPFKGDKGIRFAKKH